MATLNEDDLYRASTQYRLWSFTPAELVSLRQSINASAAQAVRAAIATKQGKQNTDEVEVQCLTVEEEQKLVNYYCTRVMDMADFSEYPTGVKATAVQYMKRFYISNSPMTYHPREIFPTALFLSTKTENVYTFLRSFATKYSLTPEAVVAPEFLLTQGLRFAFDVRHPTRGLEGGFMELMALAKGERGQAAKRQMTNIAPNPKTGKFAKTEHDLVSRIGTAHDKANLSLKTAALLTDVYFHYTPSQIWMSAFMLHDAPLVNFLVEMSIPSDTELRSRVLNTIRECVKMLEASPSAKPGAEELEELKRIDKKLYKCRNPDKIDLVGLNKSQKREGDENGIDEKTIKKRKLEREKMEKEGDELFGPALPK